jgi:membrane protease subunit (stomatin/prohibitin family)
LLKLRDFLKQKFDQGLTKHIPVLTTLKNWSKAFNWQKRSLEKLLDKLHQNSTVTAPSLRTLKRWSKAFNWQKRIEQRG